ncbi:hypothetical protein ACSBR2_041041 [Camellia fascicularis]
MNELQELEYGMWASDVNYLRSVIIGLEAILLSLGPRPFYYYWARGCSVIIGPEAVLKCIDKKDIHELHEEEMDDRFAEFNEDVDIVKPELKVGMRFKNAQKLESNKEDARNCFASFASELKFEMDCYDITHVVDLRARTCGCRDCDLTGIPCKHAISYIYLTREKPEAYLHNYFSKETYLRTYSFMINPVPGEHDWIETEYDAIAPHYFRNQ